MTRTQDLVVCGRVFSADDLETVRRIIAMDPGRNRRQIALQTCEALGWVRVDGRFKEMSCRVALLRLERLGCIRLPPPRRGHPNHKPYQVKETLVAPREPVVCPVDEFAAIRLVPVMGSDASRLWNEVIHRFHYLGYTRLAGAQMRYLIESERGLVGAIGFGASAWKVGPRDEWIGWNEAQRRSRLHLIVNNARFLLLPWIRSPNLASWVLSHAARRIPRDFQARYGYRPVLLETFVERDRFRGMCYQAANWQYLGDTQGRGKLDRHHKRELPIKRIFVYPLRADSRRLLCLPEVGADRRSRDPTS